MSGVLCSLGFNNEIDIVELKFNHPRPTLDNNIFYWGTPCGTLSYSPFDDVLENQFMWGGTHTFKCVWTSSKIEFWVDNTLLRQANNTGQYWYPQLQQRVILSQQIIDYNNNSPGYGIVTPQTSQFHWVKVKQFFLAPEINCPTVICSNGTATMDVDPAVLNSVISWTLAPSNLFAGTTSGTGRIANITASPSNQGKGKITYSFTISSDLANPKEIYTAEKDVWIKGPDISEVSFDVYRSDGVRATKTGNTFLMCPNTTYHIYAMNSGPVPLSNYSWSVPSAWTQYYTYQNMISVYTNSSPGGPVTVNATNTASGCNNTVQVITGYMGSSYSCGTYYMAFTPNPATNQTTIELSADGEKVVDENTQWQFEVYDQQKLVKDKKTKLKGKAYKLDTQGWKAGVYIVRAIIGEEQISEKLMVKH